MTPPVGTAPTATGLGPQRLSGPQGLGEGRGGLPARTASPRGSPDSRLLPKHWGHSEPSAPARDEPQLVRTEALNF